MVIEKSAINRPSYESQSSSRKLVNTADHKSMSPVIHTIFQHIPVTKASSFPVPVPVVVQELFHRPALKCYHFSVIERIVSPGT
jgi:hypothetical protein